MTDAVRVEDDGHGHVRLVGELDARTVPDLLGRIDRWLGNDGGLRLDLGGIERADSAGVAFLLEVQRRADRAGRTAEFANAPQQMRAIVSFCGLEQVIPAAA